MRDSNLLWKFFDTTTHLILSGMALGAFLGFSTSSLLAAPPIILNESVKEYPIGLHVDILEDPSGQLTLEEVLSEKVAQGFVPSEDEIPNYGITTSAYWVRFRLESTAAQRLQWFLEINKQYLRQNDDVAY